LITDIAKAATLKYNLTRKICDASVNKFTLNHNQIKYNNSAHLLHIL